jgi:hypothetical protein
LDLKPAIRFELMTFRLQVGCTTTVLCWRSTRLGRSQNFSVLGIIPISHLTISQLIAQRQVQKKKKCLLCHIFVIFPPVNDLLKAAKAILNLRAEHQNIW